MTQLLVLAIALLAAGAMVGFLAGVFGVGGGTVVVPILYHVFLWFSVPDDLRDATLRRNLTGTDHPDLNRLLQNAPRGDCDRHRAAEEMDTARHSRRPGRHRPGTLCAGGAVQGGLCLDCAPHGGAAHLSELPAKARGRHAQRFVAPYGLIIGASASLIGIGGGLLSNMVMTLHGRAIHQAVATSSGVGVMVSLPGAIGYMAAGWDKTGLPPYSIGFVSIAAVLLLMPASLLTAKLGALVAHSASKHRLEVAFAAYLILVSAHFCASLVSA